MQKLSPDQTLLLVEDNEDDVYLMRRALRDAGINNLLHVVEDGQAALEYLAGEGKFADRQLHPMPALVFLDLNLPLKSGHEVLAWMRRKQLETVVIVLTSSAEPEDLRRAYRLGANSYLTKPPTAEQLLELVKAFKWYWLNFNEFQPTSGAVFGFS
jgi:CheY-like chemotaxis protein